MSLTRTENGDRVDTVAIVVPGGRRHAHSIFPRRLNWFYVPALVLFAVFSVYPLISGMSLSLTNWNGGRKLYLFHTPNTPSW